MRILALETSGFSGSVAALEAGAVVHEFTLPATARSAQALAPAMQSLLSHVGWRARDVELVAVIVGPGSFTGLRVGVATAKTFAYATGAQVLGVDTLAAIAADVPPAAGSLHLALEALRKELFATAFVHDGAVWRAQLPTRLISEAEWLAALAPGDTACGPALARLREKLPGQVKVAPTELWSPRAAAVGRVAQRLYDAGMRHDFWRLLPEYLRPSAAEEKK